MNAIRRYLAQSAKLLVLLVLLNGLACSYGHGQMMRPLFELSGHQAASMNAHGHGAMHGMASMTDIADMHEQTGIHETATDHSLSMPGMNSPFGDCLFAGTMPIGIIVFALISWLLRHRESRPRARLTLFGALPRSILPKLNPRAP